jgi:hypothetical protein
MNFPHCSDEAFRPLRGYAPRKSRPWTGASDSKRNEAHCR